MGGGGGAGVRGLGMEKLWVFSFLSTLHLRADMHVMDWRMDGGIAYLLPPG